MHTCGRKWMECKKSGYEDGKDECLTFYGFMLLNFLTFKKKAPVFINYDLREKNSNSSKKPKIKESSGRSTHWRAVLEVYSGRLKTTLIAATCSSLDIRYGIFQQRVM